MDPYRDTGETVPGRSQLLLAFVAGAVVGAPLLLCLGSGIAVVGLTLLGQSLENKFEHVADEVQAGP